MSTPNINKKKGTAGTNDLLTVNTVIAAVIVADPMKIVQKGLHQNATAEIDVAKGLRHRLLVVEVDQKVVKISWSLKTSVVKRR